MLKYKEEKAITLVVLVVTVVVLLILATITIGTLGDNGILIQSQGAKEDSEIGEEKKILDISVVGAMERDIYGKVEEEKLNNALKENIGEGNYKLDSTSSEEKFVVIFTKSNRQYLVDKEGNIKEWAGNKTEAQVKVTPIDITSSTITVEVNATDDGDGMPEEPIYIYYIKEATSSEYIEKAKTTDFTYTFGGLKQDTTYDIQVKTEDKAGNIEKGETTATTGTVPNGNGIIIFGTPIWNNCQASVTISTAITGYTIEYQKNDIKGTWSPIENGGTVNGLYNEDTVYARLTDGTNYGDYASITIIDQIGPIVNVIPSSTTTRSIEVDVIAIDNESGIPEDSTYTYYIKKSTETTYEEIISDRWSSYYTFDGLEQNTSYDIKVTIEDSAGNEGAGEALRVTTGTVPNGIESGAITFGTPVWNNGKASVTISTSKTEYKIQYQKNSIDGTWTSISNGGKVSNLLHADTVYARLTDGINYGDYASLTINDGISPTITSFAVTGYDTTSISVKVVANDNESGIANYKYAYKKSTETTYTTATTTTETTYTYTGLADGTTYNLRVTAIDKAGNEKTSEVTQATVTANVGPVITSVALNSKTTSSMTIRATATDADGDNITYKLYTGTSSSNLSLASTSSATSSGTAVSLSKSSLSSYTTYYYRIDASDGKATTTGTVYSARTYCPGNGLTCSGTTLYCAGLTATCNTFNQYCSGGREVNGTCGSCGGSGDVSCPGGTKSYSGTMNCGGTCKGTVSYTEYDCAGCGAGIYTEYDCDRCGSSSNTWNGCDGTKTCNSCGGTGGSSYTNPCTHGYTGSHYYCSHGKTSSHSYYVTCSHSKSGTHYYCAHNYNGTSHSYCSHDKTSQHD